MRKSHSGTTHMKTVHQQIVATFLSTLGESEVVDAQTLRELGDLMTTGKKIKPDELVRIFSEPKGGDVK
jgi:hypothetical protein